MTLDTFVRVALLVLGALGFVLTGAGIWHSIPAPAWVWLSGTTVTVWGSHAALAHQDRQHKHEDGQLPGAPAPQPEDPH